jgi:myo-inositol-1(or 4)-monophosphatase
MTDHLQVAINAAREAGEMLKKNFGTQVKVERKADRSLVSTFDRVAERIIIGRLQEDFPSWSVIGEESGISATGSEYCWVIDPLDGTHNYLRNIPVYGVSIGLMRGEEFVAGVIYMPAEGDCYAAEQGAGAWKNGQRITVSQGATIEECSMASDSDFRSDVEQKIHFLRQFAPRLFFIRMTGSSARNLTFLAEGIIDMVIEFNDPIWDFAAGTVLIREAGGKITDHRGGEHLTDRDCYIATNGHLHAAALSMLA